MRDTRARLEQTDDPQAAVDVLQELSEIAKEVEVRRNAGFTHAPKADRIGAPNDDPVYCMRALGAASNERPSRQRAED